MASPKRPVVAVDRLTGRITARFGSIIIFSFIVMNIIEIAI